MNTLSGHYELFKGPCGDGDKGTFHSYIDTYEKYFNKLKDEKINLLEIGILNGKSIKLWESFFKNANIYAVDINDKTHLNLSSERIFIYKNDATLKSFSDEFNENYFSIIIDDGSHLLNDQINSFRNLKSKLINGGLYIIEDVFFHHIEEIQKEFKNCFKVYNLLHERPGCPDNILMIYEHK
jgi:NDP-sugar pyrophosphorylase family protein